jgi:hypothetical protein
VDPELTVGDDLGTRYEARPLSWSRSGRDARGQITIVPAPPTDAASLSLEFGVFAAPLEAGPAETFVRTVVRLRD